MTRRQITAAPRGGLYRDALRERAFGRRVGTSLEGHAILRRDDGEVFVVPVHRLRQIRVSTRKYRALRTRKAFTDPETVVEL